MRSPSKKTYFFFVNNSVKSEKTSESYFCWTVKQQIVLNGRRIYIFSPVLQQMPVYGFMWFVFAAVQLI